MRIKTIVCSLLTLGILAAIEARTAQAADKSQSQLEAQAKITRSQAEKTIHKLWRQGKIKTAELEEENGNLIWSFDIVVPDSKDIIEAHVDAKTGKVVSVDTESPADEKKEAKVEAKESKAKKSSKKSQKEDDEKISKESKKEGKGKKSVKEDDTAKEKKESK